MPPLALALLMAIAAYRLTRLVVRDTFPPILWIRDRLAGGWRQLTLEESDDHKLAGVITSRTPYLADDDDEGRIRYVTRWKRSPYWLAELITCPWCASAYVSGLLTLAVDLTIGIPAPYLVGLAVWGAAALLASKEWA